MESRKESLSSLRICRFCLSQDASLTSIYKRGRTPKNAISLPLKILSCVSMEVYPSDKMPTFICGRCKFFLDIGYEFKRICRQADENTLQYVQTGTLLDPISWPSALTKIYRQFSGTKASKEVSMMKTVIDGGATVQVTTQELSDTDAEDDENVFNIKIEDGSEGGGKNACIKVIAGTDKEETPKAKPKRAPKGFPSIPKLTQHVRAHAVERAFPCKYCSKTFVKSHHYTRHLRMKHNETLRNRRGPFGEVEQFRCDQCEDSFTTQDELIYHSAIHATQNLICPLCQEKFADVEAVTMHIKSHASGSEFMCDYCELIFTTKEKLDNHLAVAHDEETRSEVTGQDESSIEMEAEEDDDDNAINVKEEDGQMVVEIKKADEFMLSNYKGDIDEKMDNTMSEDSEVENTYTELSTVDPLAMMKKDSKVQEEKGIAKTTSEPQTVITGKIQGKNNSQTASILRKAEEMKRKVIQRNPENASEKKETPNNKVESTTSAGGNDKSLRLLEKELQELKRTNTRTETVKAASAKSIEAFRNRRPQIHTSTPKIRNTDEKKSQQIVKLAASEKKVPERRLITKENKEPKEIKDNKNNNGKEDKDKETKEKERFVGVVKNGTSDKSAPEDGVRRSTRPSKIKDYAKMIRESSQASDDTDDDSDEADDDDEEFKEIEKAAEARPKLRRSSAKQSPRPPGTPPVPSPSPAPAATAAPAAAAPAPAAPAAAPRKRGRPRKDTQQSQLPNKVKKEEPEENAEPKENSTPAVQKPEEENIDKPKEATQTPEKTTEVKNITPERPVDFKQSPNILLSPTGQTLKKVPVKALPPGVKPLPLPVNARPVGSAELCEMQIGKKLVKVQKIVMTKAEVEAMAKKGLVEMKDGTMVLKQGIKLPQQDPMGLKSSLVEGESSKESPSKKGKATPSRCDFGDDTS